MIHRTVVKNELPESKIIQRSIKMHFHDGHTALFMNGGWLVDVHTANHPSGEPVRIQLKSQQFVVGELLAVKDQSVYVLSNVNEIVHIDFSVTEEVILGRDQKMKIRSNQLPARDLQKYRNVSRFPQGISEALLHRLLSAYKQEELVLIWSD